MTFLFTADTHFCHSAILGHCQRPFSSSEEMDDVMIRNWNAIVQPKDDVWHLGDFAFGSTEAADRILRHLHGRKHLIWGNHDKGAVRELPQWTTSQPMAEVKVEGVRIVLLHYAMRVWNASHHGGLHLYGHSHGALPGDRQSCDVGVDAWDFRPVTLKEIQERLATLPERGGVCS
jgi:calcineurin-like phosphoesterase family protein